MKQADFSPFHVLAGGWNAFQRKGHHIYRQMTLLSFVCYNYAAIIIIFNEDFWSLFFGDNCHLYWDEMHSFFSMFIACLLIAYGMTHDFGNAKLVQAFIWAMCFVFTSIYSDSITPLFACINMTTGFVGILYIFLHEIYEQSC